jgi:DUF1680 family protein
MTTTRIRARMVLSAALAAASAGAGDLEERFRLSLDRVLAGGPPEFTKEFVLADALPAHTRRFTEFSGDVSGRYLDALARAEAVTGERIAALDAILDGLAAAQKPAGFFGDDFPDGEIKGRPHMSLLWGNGRMLTGLVEVHRRRGDAKSLAIARKLGDFLVAIGPRLNDEAVAKAFSGDQHAVGYICWTQIIEALVGLNAATKDARYLDLARAMAGHVFMHEGQHSHGFLTALRGMVDLSAATGERQWLDRAAALWQKVVDTGNLLPHGCIPEAFKPMILRDEGCSEADWVRLSLQLWHATHATKYLEAAEHAVFNEFALNQFSTGDFGHRTISALGAGGAVTRAPKGGATNQAFSAVSIAYGQARAWWCCTFHGLRAIPDIMDSVFRADGNTLAYDLPFDGHGRIEGLALKAVSTLGKDETCRIEVVESDGFEHIVAVRCPAWADAPRITVNGGGAAEGEGGAVRTIHREWRKGDVLAIRYPLRTRTVKNPSNPALVGFARGPWILGAEPDGSPAFFDEPMSQTVIRVPGLPERPELAPAPEVAPDSAGVFALPAARAGLPFIPGGYPMQPQVALLRPIAEQTGLRDMNEWVFWFRPAGP